MSESSTDYKKRYEEIEKEIKKYEERAKKLSNVFTLQIFPGYVVERHISSKSIGELAPLSPLQQGIVRKIMFNGTVEFLLASTIVKLEPLYLLKEDETLVIRKRPEISVLQVDSVEIRKRYFIVFKRMLANKEMGQGWKRDNRKFESLYSFGGEIIVCGHVVGVYNDGVVISADLNNPDDFTNWIFMGLSDLKDISVFEHPTYCSTQQAALHIEKSKIEIQEILQFNAGMIVEVNNQTRRIEYLFWRTDNILDRKVSFDGINGPTTHISALKKAKNQTVSKVLPPNKGQLKLSQGTSLIQSNGKYKIVGFDNDGVIVKAVQTDSPVPNQSHHAFIPYSFFEKSTL